MRYLDKIHTGTIKKMWASAESRTPKRPDYLNGTSVSLLEFTLEGIEGDRHKSFTLVSGGRQKTVYKRGTVIKNHRMWTAISPEEVAQIGSNLEVEGLEAGHMGFNLLIEGLGPITQLPPLTLLVLSPYDTFEIGREEDVTLLVYAEVLPCEIAGSSVAAIFNRPELATQFPKAAIGLRGCTGWVEKAGTVEQGWFVHQLTPLYKD